ncbi:MFS transporter [Streptomyces sp. NBC_00638]|uniref:MFS transporter n=1 Tax=unclassified Streptomyces TaxID=2593676 RepID=UPI00224EA2E8|nr:MFS transporter [Streptomyces sp. NBC_00638]MCX5001131.1 MFS transporter [Streptomyces sp. NBC_00638]
MNGAEAPARGPGYPTIAVLASGAMFLAILDSTIANLAVSDMHETFREASISDFSWVITLYAIFFAALLAPAGRLADAVGRRALYSMGVGVFTVASLLCAVAPYLPFLLVSRAVQGAGAAAMIPASLAVILFDTPPARRMAAIGLWSAAGSTAAAIGPSLGGVLIDAFGWRTVFLINVPIGIALMIGVRAVRRSERVPGRVPDVAGSLALAIGMGGVVLGVTQGSDWGWGDPRTLGCLLAGIAVLAYGVLRARTQPVPAIDTTLWRSRTFSLANVVSFFYGAALYAWLLCGVLYLVNVWRYSELKAGFVLSPGAVFSAIAAVGIGRLLGRRASPRLMVVGGSLLIVGIGVWLVAVLPAEPHLVDLWLPTTAISGFGMGAVSTGVSSAAALSVPPGQFAGATGLNMAARQMGGALGIAVLASVLAGADTSATTAYVHVLLFSTVMAAMAGLAGLGLSLKPGPRPPAPVTTPATETAATTGGEA